MKLLTCWQWGAGLAVSVGAVGCAGRTNPTTASPMERCEIGDSTMVRDVLYFGRNRPRSGVVTDLEWQEFLDQVVTPRFPAGLTVVSADGQWRGQNGSLEHERAEVLTLFHAGDAVARRAVSEVIAEYKRRFQQEAVLRERTPTCALLGVESRSEPENGTLSDLPKTIVSSLNGPLVQFP